MQRDLTALAANGYDLLIIGGGIYGACVAWDATLRGLSVALVDRADFGSATSANSLKIIHGGLRYLQHADFRRMRESICERRTLMRLAPHLVAPLPVLIPTYGHGLQSKAALALALMTHDLVGWDRNRHSDPSKYVPRGRVVSRKACLRLLPGVRREGLTGGAFFYDAQVHNSERLLLTFLRSAAEAGAALANYVEVVGFLSAPGRVTGVQVKDLLSGDHFDIRAKTVVNTSGPWMNYTIGLRNGRQPRTYTRFAKAINLISRPLFDAYAVGLPGGGGFRDTDAVLNKGNRLLFITPWRDRSLIGTAYSVDEKGPDAFQVTVPDIDNFLSDINHAYPLANLKREEISFVHGGLVPISGTDDKTGDVRLAKHEQIYDHESEGSKGLLSVVGVKYTTARQVAEKAVNRVFEKWGYRPARSTSSVSPLYGGQIEDCNAFMRTEVRKRPYGLPEEAVHRLICNYGSAYSQVLRYIDRCANEDDTHTDRFAVLRAEVLHGVREEMACKLSDVVFRRTELGTIGHPGHERLSVCAEVMGQALKWGPEKTQQELQEVNRIFASRAAL